MEESPQIDSSINVQGASNQINVGDNNIVIDRSPEVHINVDKTKFTRLSAERWHLYGQKLNVQKKGDLAGKASLFLSVVALFFTLSNAFSSLITILSFFGIKTIGTATLIGLGLFGLARLIYLLFKRDIKLAKALRNEGDQIIINKVPYLLENGKIYSATLQAKCIYPYCQGIVTLASPPFKEREKHNFIGCCSQDILRHTYSVDNNLVITPCSIDWSRPETQNGSKN